MPSVCGSSQAQHGNPSVGMLPPSNSTRARGHAGARAGARRPVALAHTMRPSLLDRLPACCLERLPFDPALARRLKLPYLPPAGRRTSTIPTSCAAPPLPDRAGAPNAISACIRVSWSVALRHQHGLSPLVTSTACRPRHQRGLFPLATSTACPPSSPARPVALVPAVQLHTGGLLEWRC